MLSLLNQCRVHQLNYVFFNVKCCYKHRTNGCLHTIVIIYGHHNGNFPMFLKYKKINKIKFINIIKKGLTYLKLS